jgi:hypothetical protein
MISSKKVEKYRKTRDIYVIQTCNKLLRVKNLIFNNNTKPSAVVLVYLKGNKLQEKCRTISSTIGRCQSTVLQTFINVSDPKSLIPDPDPAF